MKEKTLCFLSQEIFNISSDEEDEVICLDDDIIIPPTAKKPKISKTTPYFSKKPRQYHSENLSSLVTVRILTKLKNEDKPITVTSIKYLSKNLFMRESEYFKCLFAVVWRESDKNTIEVEIPGLADIDLLGIERDKIISLHPEKVIEDCEYTKHELRLLEKIVDEFFAAFISMKISINQKNMLVYHRLADYFMVVNFKKTIEDFIISSINIGNFEHRVADVQKFSPFLYEKFIGVLGRLEEYVNLLDRANSNNVAQPTVNRTISANQNQFFQNRCAMTMQTHDK